MESHSQSVILPVCLTLFICWESFIHICWCASVGGCRSNSISMADVDLLFCLSVCFSRASVIVNRVLGAEWGHPSSGRHTHFVSATDWGVPPSQPDSPQSQSDGWKQIHTCRSTNLLNPAWLHCCWRQPDYLDSHCFHLLEITFGGDRLPPRAPPKQKLPNFVLACSASFILFPPQLFYGY